MPNDLRTDYADKSLDELHQLAEAKVRSFSYVRPNVDVQTKGVVRLVPGELIHSFVQIVRKNGGENNLHFHKNVETFWMVIKGRARFYGPGDVLLKELGPGEGIITPRYTRYWFECISDEDLELLQVAASDSRRTGHSDRTEVGARRPRQDIGAGFGKVIELEDAQKPGVSN